MGSSLPNELSYLRTAARHFGPGYRYWSGRGRVEGDGETWRSLAEAYQTMCRREDAMVIALWLAEPVESAAHRAERVQVRGLMKLLRSLGRAGVKPFDEPVLRLPRVRAAAGDSATEVGSLPDRLRYVVARALRLGIRPRWHRLAEFIDAMTERKFNALVATADRMRRRGDDRLLRRWLSGHSRQETREIAVARGLLHVFDALEIF